MFAHARRITALLATSLVAGACAVNAASTPHFPPATPTAPPAADRSPAPLPTGPTADSFWERAATGIRHAGRLRLDVIGPAPGELRYVADASATVIGDDVVFVCIGSSAFDGQSGWSELNGTWACGVDALVAGFRQTGQPLDAWGEHLTPDEGIVERLEPLADGSWRWTYRGRSPYAGGEVRSVAVLDPGTGQLRFAQRSDPTGDTTYDISYAEAFPAIAVP